MAGRFFEANINLTPRRENVTEKPVSFIQSKASTRPMSPLRSQDGPDLVTQRVNLHRYLLDKINLAALEAAEDHEVQVMLRPLIRDYIKSSNFPLNTKELDELTQDIAEEMLGLGPIEPILSDDTISDILIVGPDRVFVERFGQLEETGVRFKDEAHLMRIVQKIVASVGRRVDESSPLVDARLPDGSRVNVAIRPVAIDGPQVSIRKFSKKALDLNGLVEKDALAQGMADLLAAAVKGRISIIVSGGTGSGKTTMLNALSAFIPSNERLVTIEDAAELQLQQLHVVRLETRPPTVDGRHEIRQRDLVKNALRMRPNRIIVGEVRGGEAFDMLQAMNTGHEGSMTTIHANNPRDALARVEQMVGMAGMPMTSSSIRHQISAAIRLIIQLERLSDGRRCVTSIAEITGMEGDVLQLQELFRFARTGIDEKGKILGEFKATGVRPRILDALALAGHNVDLAIFDPSKRL